MSIIEDLVRNILGIRYESFDKETVEQAKDRMIDTVGCIVGGAKGPGCRRVADLAKKWGGEKKSTILVHGVKAPAHTVAFVNTLMARSFDFEPVEPYVEGIPTPAHISGTTVPTALAVAEERAASGKELITALILGDDLTSRLVAASGFSFDLGWDNTGTVNMFGATAIAGRLWGLDEARMLNAFGIVLNQMAGSFQSVFDGTLCFKLPQALAARAGIFSVELANGGFTGVKDPLLSKHGYFALYCRTPRPEALTKDLGKIFYADRTFKPYPCCRLTHAAIDCALELVHTHDLRAEEIDLVTLNVTPVAYRSFVGQPFEIGDVPQANAAFSLRYTVANALLRRSVTLEHFTEKFIRAPKVVDLANSMKLTGTMAPEKMFNTDLEVRTKDGRTFAAHTDVPKGDTFHHPLSREEIREKFRTNVKFSRAVAKENAEKALRLLERLEEVDDVRKIIGHLVRV